jgi:hypothetical protein
LRFSGRLKVIRFTPFSMLTVSFALDDIAIPFQSRVFESVQEGAFSHTEG